MSLNVDFKSNRRSRSWESTVIVNYRYIYYGITLLLALCISHATAYSIHMEYKPPVKTSVGKLHSSWFDKESRGGEISSDKKPSRFSTSKLDYASGALAPTQSIGVGSRFERRMRDLVFGGNKKSRVSSVVSTRERQLPPNVMVIETLSEYKVAVADEKQRMVVVRFFAPWCKACKAVEPLFYRMARLNPNSLFVDVPVTEMNANLHQGLGVERLPTCHMYHPTAGLVEELRFTKSHFRKAVKIFESYEQGFCGELEVDGETGLFSSPYKRKK